MKKLMAGLTVFGALVSGAAMGAIEHIDMDTPVVWEPRVFNFAIEDILGGTDFYKAEWDADYGEFNERLPSAIADFIDAFIDESHGGRRGVSLQEMADLCLDSGVAPLFCEQFAMRLLHTNNDIGYAMGSTLPDDVRDIYSGDKKIYSDDGKFYAKIMMKNDGFTPYIVYRTADNLMMCSSNHITQGCTVDQDRVVVHPKMDVTNDWLWFSLYDSIQDYSFNDEGNMEIKINDDVVTQAPKLRYGSASELLW